MKPRAQLRSPWIASVLAPALLISLLGLTLPGCGDKKGPSPTDDTPDSTAAAKPAPGATTAIPPSKGTAADVLDRMVQAYKNAKSYRDAAVLQLNGTRNGKPEQLAFANAVAMERPNKVRMQVDSGTLLCDGANTYGFSSDLPDQVLKIPAPAELSMKDIYPDALLARSMMKSPAQSFCWAPVQLVLLLAGDPMKTLTLDNQGVNLMTPGMIEQHPCDRVQLLTDNGPGVLWIDQATSVLRRFELPINALVREAESQQFLNPSLIIEYRDAQLNTLIPPEAFQFKLPPNMDTVDALMMPILKVLGQPFPDFQFQDADGNTTATSSLLGKVVVMQLWSSKDSSCRPVLQAASKAYTELKSRDDVAMMAVNLEGGNVQNASLQTVLKDWGVELPIYRDLQQSVANHFGLARLPVTIILGKKGNMQSLQAGQLENMDALVAMVIERLQSGENIYQSAFAQFENERAGFKMMVEQCVADDVYCLRPMIPRTQVIPHTEPANLKMTKLWSCDKLEHPGNIALVPTDSGPPRILVMDSGKTAVELKTDGSVAAAHALELQGNEPVMVLRTALAKDGKRYFLGTARGVQRVHLFDEDLKTILVYPDSQHQGIVDAQLADLNGNGIPEMILGYAGPTGVHAVDLQGNRLWKNSSMVDAIRVATLTPDATGRRNVLAMNGGVGGGTLVELDSEGKRVREITVPNRSVGWVVAEDLAGDGTSDVCALALAMTPEGQPATDTIDALGINLEGQALWQYPLPRGVHHEYIEPIITGNVFADGPNQWLIAAADSTITVVASDGQVVDSFAYGTELSGLATAQWDGKVILLVSTPQSVDAWQVELAGKVAAPALSPVTE